MPTLVADQTARGSCRLVFSQLYGCFATGIMFIGCVSAGFRCRLAGIYRVTAYINIMIIRKDIDLDDINIEIAVLFTIYYSLMKICVKMKNVV